MKFDHLFVTLNFPPNHGGVARYYDNLVQQFPAHSVCVLTQPADDASTASVPVMRHTLLAPHWIWPRWIPLVWWMTVLVLRYRPRWVHVGEVLPIGTAALLVQKLCHFRFVAYTHGFDVQMPQPTARKVYLRNTVLRKADLVVTNSLFTKKLLLDCGVEEKNIVLVYPGCSLVGVHVDAEQASAMRQQLQLGDAPVLLTISRLVARKGIDASLRAFAALLSTHPQAVYCIAGDGPERGILQSLAQELGVAHAVRFLGSVDDAQLPTLYSLCTLFVLTPRALQEGRDVEGFGIVYQEAAAFAKPVIGTRTGGVPESVQDGMTGVLVAPDDIPAITQAMAALLDDPARMTELGTAGQAHVAAIGTWHHRAQPLLTELAHDADR